VEAPCIERCAFGAVKAWTAFMIAASEIASRHRVDLDVLLEGNRTCARGPAIKP
jgi:L-serine dehydratase